MGGSTPSGTVCVCGGGGGGRGEGGVGVCGELSTCSYISLLNQKKWTSVTRT